MNSEKHQKQIDQVTIDDLSEADEVFGAGNCFGTLGTAGCPGCFGPYGCTTQFLQGSLNIFLQVLTRI